MKKIFLFIVYYQRVIFKVVRHMPLIFSLRGMFIFFQVAVMSFELRKLENPDLLSLCFCKY